MSAIIPDLSLVVACYQEAEHLEGSYERLIRHLSLSRFSYEIIFVEDCSRDNTREIIKSLIESHPDVVSKCHFNAENMGRGYSVTKGIRMAEGKVVGFIDIDLEVSPAYIASCVDRILRGHSDMVIGKRHYNFSIFKLHRYLMTKGYQVLTDWLLDLPVEDTESGYKFFDREKILPVLDQCKDPGWFWDSEITLRAHENGLRLSEIDCLFKKRDDKTSTVNVISDSIRHFKCLMAYKKSKV